MIHRLDDKKLYVGNQGIDRVYLGGELLKSNAPLGYYDKPGFDFLPSDIRVYQADFSSQDTDKTFVSSGFGESLGEYQDGGFRFNNLSGSPNTQFLIPEIANGNGVVFEMNAHIYKDGVGTEHLFQMRISSVNLHVYNNYDSERVEVVGTIPGRDDLNFTKHIPWTNKGNINLLIYGVNREAYGSRGAYVEGEKLGDSPYTSTYSANRLYLYQYGDYLLYEVNAYVPLSAYAAGDEHRDNIYNRALNYYY